MRKNLWKRWLMLLVISSAMMFGLSGCGEKEAKQETEEKTADITTDEMKELDESEETEILEEDEADASTKAEKASEEDSEAEEKETVKVDKLLEQYYEEVLLPKEGLIELPAGYEVPIKERHFEDFTVGEAFLEEAGICYHAVWDYDKDEQDELLVLLLDEDEDYERCKLYARMYEVIDGEVVENAELESLLGWMEYDVSQSTEVFLRETKDWFYLAEEARGTSGIYADGSAYIIRVAHYDGTEFVVDLAKQMSGSDFSDTKEEVADTARLLRNVKFDHTADGLTYEYKFNTKDDLLSVFYMTAEHNGSLSTYFKTGNISDVPPFIIRAFKEHE